MSAAEMYREDWHCAVERLIDAAHSVVDGRDLSKDRLTMRTDQLSDLRWALDELREAQIKLEVRGLRP